MNIELDNIDMELIKLLREDGRYKNYILAQKLGISRSIVQKRVQRLLDEGIIHITVEVFVTQGRGPIGLVIGLYVIKKKQDSVIEELINHYPIMRVAKTFGRFNLLVLASFLDINELSNYMLNKFAFVDSIINSETFLILQPEGKDLGGNIDELDRRIIGVLREDGRLSATEASKRIGANLVTTQRRIKRLIKEKCINAVAQVDPTKVAWYRPAMLGISVERPMLFQVLSTLSEHPDITIAFCSTGSYDVIAEIENVRSLERLYEIVERELSSIEGITNCDLFVISETKAGRTWWI